MKCALGIWVCLLALCRSFDPNEREIRRALAFQSPSESWGRQARQERELRLYCIGGSNTRNDHYPKSILRGFNAYAHPGWNVSMSRFGTGGLQPPDVIYRSFEFEHWNRSAWPNVLLLELSANIHNWKNTTLDQNVDTLVYTLRGKYSKIGLPEPSIMFLELFSVRDLAEGMNIHPNASREQKLNALTYVNDGSDICNVVQLSKCPYYFAVRRVAEFYNYPIVSWRELAYKAFVRYYLAANTSFTEKKWLYTIDGLHISQSGGVLLFNTLIRPFFDQVMTPRDEPEWDAQKTIAANRLQPRIYPEFSGADAVLRASWWGSDILELVRQPSSWGLFSPHSNEVILCESSVTAALQLDIRVPDECRTTYGCTMSANFLHSWNTSYTGHLSCELFYKSKSIEKVLINSTLNVGGELMKHTHGVKTDFRSSLRPGENSLVCTKLDNKLTCLTSLLIQGKV